LRKAKMLSGKLSPKAKAMETPAGMSTEDRADEHCNR